MPIVDLPFAYAVEMMPKRHRTPFRTHVRDVAPFEVPELSEGRMPLVAECEFGGCDVGYRSFEGRLYQAVMVSEREGGRKIPVDEFLADNLDRTRFHRPIFSGTGRGWDADYHCPLLPALAHHGYGRSHPMNCLTREEAILRLSAENKHVSVRILSEERELGISQAMQAYRDGLAILDGEVWSARNALEPWYAVHRDLKANLVVLDVCFGHMPTGAAPFRADRRDDALAYARSFAERLGLPLEEKPPIVVHRSDLLSMDEPTYLAIGMLKALPRFDSRDEWPEAAVVARHSMRECFVPHVIDARAPEIAQGLDVEVVPVVIAAAKAIVSAMSDPGSNDEYEAPEAVVALRTLVEHWDDCLAERHPEVASRVSLDAEEDFANAFGM